MNARTVLIGVAVAGAACLSGFLLLRAPREPDEQGAWTAVEPSSAAAVRSARSPDELELRGEPTRNSLPDSAAQTPSSATDAHPAARADEPPPKPAEYGAATREQLKSELERAARLYDELVAAEFERKFAAGDYRVIGHGGKYEISDWDQSLINRVEMSGEPDAPIKKCTLLEADYPDLYDLKHKKEWLEKRLAELSVADGTQGSNPR